MIQNRLFQFIALVLLISLSLYTQAKVKRLSPDEGLSQSYVNNLIVDKKGYLWLATHGGLNKYDGYQVIKVRGPDDVLVDANIDSIYQDQKGYIWIASYLLGLFRYDPDTAEFKQFISRPVTTEQAELQAVFSMLYDNESDLLWIGRSKDLAVLDLKTGEIKSVFNIPHVGELSAVRKIFKYKGVLYIGTTDGAFVYNIKTGQWRLLNHLSDKIRNTEQNNVKSFALDGTDHIWVGAVRGLYRVDISNVNALFETPELAFSSEETINDLNIWKIHNKQGLLKIATDKGLFDFYPKTNHLEKHQQLSDSGFIMPDTSIVDMLEDQHGSMWVATKTDGAFFIPNENYRFYNYHNQNTSGDGFSHYNVWAIDQDDQTLWIGTDNGLTKFNLQNYTSKVYLQNFDKTRYDPDFRIHQHFLFNNKLWMITSKGLYEFDPKTEQAKKAYTNENTHFLQGWLQTGYMTADGLLFMVHQDHGMFTIDLTTSVVTPFTGDFKKIDPFLASNFLPPLPDKPNSPLFFTNGKLYQVNARQEINTIFELDNNVNNHSILLNAYIIDKNNVLWLSFNNLGLIGLNADTYEILYELDGKKELTGSLLYDMYADDFGMIWMSSHKGIWRFNPNNQHFQQYSVDDGLATNEFNAGASVKLDDGRIVYGSVKGITIFSPEMNRPNNMLINQVNITSVELMSRQLNLPEMSSVNSIELAHDDIGLEVTFSAMAFKYQQRIKYEYQLSDEKKVAVGNTNRVIFPRLSPGNYKLTVRAQDPLTGVFTPAQSLAIKVNYAPWKSPLMLTVYGFLLLSIICIWLIRRAQMQHKLLLAHKETSDSEARLKLALDGSHSGVWDWQNDSPYIYQPRLIQELGYEKDKISFDDYLKIIHPQDKAKFRIEWLEFISTDKGYFDCTYRLRHKTGPWRWYKDLGKVMGWHNEQAIKVAGTYTNMTRELVFEQSARLFGAAFEHTSDWVVIFDTKFRIRATNQSLRDAFDFSKEVISSRKLNLGLNKDTRLNYLRIAAKLKAGEHFQFNEVITSHDGISHPVIVKVSAIADKNQQIENYIVVFTDISEQKEAEKEMGMLARYDELTKLPNRSLLLDRIKHATDLSHEHNNKMALLFININRFKKINASYGHDFGDKLLVEVALRLQQPLKVQDTLGRLSGDEFVILLEDLTLGDQALPICHSLMLAMQAPISCGSEVVPLSVSIGVAIFPDDAQQPTELLKAADMAMFHAKKQGKGSFQFFHQEMNHKIQRTIQLETALVNAIKHGELQNYYQPIVCAKNNNVVGFEVLIRWTNNGKKIDPVDFIPMAEKCGVITQLTFLILQRALVDLTQWLKIFPECYLSINLSAHDFEQDNLAEEVSALIMQSGINAKHIAFELTESAMMHDSSKPFEIMSQLKSLGCRLYLDDFGTGYSSLSYLKRYPIDVLKIDRSFVKEIGIDNNDEAIVKSTLALAHSLGKKCIAEGVETSEQLAFLQAIDCDLLQGTLFSRPVPANKVAGLLTGPSIAEEIPIT